MDDTPTEQGTPQRTLNFIPDQAADSDDFGSHGPLAKTIAAVIRSRRDLKVIGLLGPWGSGKSTVVQFIGAELGRDGGNDRVFCFTYDAWLHQSDPPRRAFLDALIRYLIEKRLTTLERWKNRLAELNRQIEDTDVTTTPTLSSAGKWLLPLALAVPLGMQFLDYESLQAFGRREASLLERAAFPLGIMLTALPLFGAAGLWFRWRTVRCVLRRSFWSKENLSKHRREYENESILSIFTSREIIKQKNRTVRTPDPTTIEFQNTFREILKEVSIDSDGRPLRFIFVVDNLDRLPEAQAVDMWGTIRSFFLGPEAGVRLPTVILPIDEAAVQRMYAAQHADGNVATALAQSFMDKTFDLSFRVSRPILSNWHRYVGKQMRYLFGDELQQDWPHLVASMYDAWLTKSGRTEPITPRQLNTLLNSIGTLWLQWHDAEISFASIAYYAIDRKKIDQNILEFVEAGGPLIAPHDPQWSRALAAMHFGVPVEEASQVLLERPIIRAVNENELSGFRRLSAAPGFALAFSRILDSALDDIASLNLVRAVMLTNEIEVVDQAQLAAIWWKLRRLRIGTFDGKAVSAADARAFEILFERCELANIPQFVAWSMSAFGRIEDGALSTPAGQEAVAKSIANVLRVATANGVKLAPLTLSLSPTPYLALMAAVGATGEATESLRTTATDDSLQAVIISALNDGTVSPAADAFLVAILKTDRKCNWGLIADAAASRLRQPYGPATVIAARVLGKLRPSQPSVAQERIDALVGDGSMLGRFHEAYNANDNPSAAALAALVLASKTPSVLTTPDGTSWTKAVKDRNELASEIGSALATFGFHSLAGFASIIDGASELEFLVRGCVAPQMVGSLLGLPEPKEVAENYGYYWRAVPSKHDLEVVSAAAASDEFWVALDTADFEDSSVALGVLLGEENEYRSRAATFAKARLDALPAGGWESAITEGEFPYEIARAVVAALPSKRISGHLAEALKTHFHNLKNDNESFRNRWFGLLRLTSNNSQKTVLRTLRDYVATQSDIKAPAALLKAGDEILLKSGELWRAADGIARNLVLPMLADGKELTWLAETDLIKPIVEGAAEEAVGVILEQLEALSGGDEERDQVDRLRSNWGLPSPTP